MSEQPIRWVTSNPRGPGRDYFSEMMRLPPREYQQLMQGDWSAYEDEGHLRYAGSPRDSRPSALVHDLHNADLRDSLSRRRVERCALEVRKLAHRSRYPDEEAVAMATTILDALKTIERLERELAQAAGWSDDNSPALGGQRSSESGAKP